MEANGQGGETCCDGETSSAPRRSREHVRCIARGSKLGVNASRQEAAPILHGKTGHVCSERTILQATEATRRHQLGADIRDRTNDGQDVVMLPMAAQAGAAEQRNASARMHALLDG